MTTLYRAARTEWRLLNALHRRRGATSGVRNAKAMLQLCDATLLCLGTLAREDLVLIRSIGGQQVRFTSTVAQAPERFSASLSVEGMKWVSASPHNRVVCWLSAQQRRMHQMNTVLTGADASLTVVGELAEQGYVDAVDEDGEQSLIRFTRGNTPLHSYRVGLTASGASLTP